MDIFDFWSEIRRGQRIHPADVDVFRRINPSKHGFRTEDCLPACYEGRLRFAPVVLLYLSPGFSDGDLHDASSETGKDYYLKRWTGSESFRDNGPGKEWLMSRTKNFGPYEKVRHDVAVLNIGAYHSTDVASYASLLALPSSRVSVDWAQQALFPQAERGERIVVCMRSAEYWGLETGRHYDGLLFAPKVTRGGHLLKTPENQRLVEKIKETLL